MKKSSLLVLAGIFALNASAQIQLNVFAGPQGTSARYVIRDKVESTNMKFGFQAGAGLKMQWEGRLYFTPQAFYSLKGFKVTLDRTSNPPDELATDNDITLHTFELAALLQYDLSSNPSHFFLRLGPTIDFQITGKEKFNRSTGGPVDRNMKFGYADYGHYGANILIHAGYESSGGLLIYGQYGLGIGSIVNTDNGPIITHRTAGITLGYYLNRK